MNTNLAVKLASLGFTGGADEVRRLSQATAPPSTTTLQADKPAAPPKKEKSATPAKAAASPKKPSGRVQKTGRRIANAQKITVGATVRVIISGRASVPVVKPGTGVGGHLTSGEHSLTAQAIEEVVWLLTKSGYGNTLDVFLTAQETPDEKISGHIEIRTGA